MSNSQGSPCVTAIVRDVKAKVEIVPPVVPAVTVAFVPLKMLVPLNFTLKTRLVTLSEYSVVK
jgi:hypothetical protein